MMNQFPPTTMKPKKKTPRPEEAFQKCEFLSVVPPVAICLNAIATQHALHKRPIAGVWISWVGDVVETDHQVMGRNHQDE